MHPLAVDLLRVGIQHYEWGDDSFIARLQGREPSGRPEAELWMGAHPGAPSRLAADDRRLDEVIAADPTSTLGASSAHRFGALPFLAKIIAAAQPLSIQTHPSATQARDGFDREEAAGVPRDAPMRIYRDARHKPELICALTRFEAKCGLRGLDATRELVAGLYRGRGRPLAELDERLGDGGNQAEVLAAVLRWLLQLDRSEAAALVAAVVDAAATVTDGPFARESRWVAPMADRYPDDPGVIVALLLNHLDLAPGEAVFLEAGNLHSYLRGAGVELMANSDNVIRGGLTSKHVDVDELLRVVDTTPIQPVVQSAIGARHRFQCLAPDFSLERIVVDQSTVVEPVGPEILIVTAGRISVTRPNDRTGTGPLVVGTGSSLWLPATGGPVTAEGTGMVFRCGAGGDATS